MKPLFTIHAGEFLVASYIEQRFKDYLVWLPSRDLGVDLLLPTKPAKWQFRFKSSSQEIFSPLTWLCAAAWTKSMWLVYAEATKAVAIHRKFLDLCFIFL